MTPDMKRLVEAAWCQVPAMDGVVIANTEPYPLCEAIVRAVLTELREVLGDGVSTSPDGSISLDEITEILAEPARK